MSRVIVSEQALRELVREALDGGHLGNLSTSENEEPVNVNPVVDPSASVTDPINPDFVPQTKQELDVAVHQLTKDITIDQVPGTYKALKAVIDSNEQKSEEDEQMKKAAQGGTNQVEESLRRQIRKLLSEINPKFVDPADAVADEEEELERKGSKKAYKSTAIGGMLDVGGASFEEIAKELGFSVAGAKQAVDKALEKARWMATQIEPDDLEILILTTMNDYIKMLNKTGELSGSDVQLMKDHPSIVRELDGFREFLHNVVRRARKSGQKVSDPLEEDTEPGDEIKMTSTFKGSPSRSNDDGSKKNVTKAKGDSGKDISVDWDNFAEARKLLSKKRKG